MFLNIEQEIIKLRRSGHSLGDISKLLGVGKDYCGYVSRKNGIHGALVSQLMQESQVADLVSRSGFDYVCGYTSSKKSITVKCRECGRTFERQAHIFFEVVRGTWECKNECPLCRADRQRTEKEKREQEQRELREREAQMKAQQKAEQLSRKVNDQLAKRLATHVCKNCGKEFCQAITGYNSETYCSEKCQKRFLNRGR
jgi:hypothetical protein